MNNKLKNQIDKLIDKFWTVFDLHGINEAQMPSFIDKRFNIKYTDLNPRENIINILNDDLINWVCARFGIQRMWFDSDNEKIYMTTSCYKEHYRFITILSNLIDEIGVYNDYRSKIKVYVFKSVKELKGNKTDSKSNILFLIETKIGVVSTGPVYKYAIIRSDMHWDYSKCRFDCKRLIAICNAFDIVVDGYDLPEDVLEKLGHGTIFPYKIANELRQYSWYPEDYISYYEKNDELENDDLKIIGNELMEIKHSVYKILEEKEEKFRLEILDRDRTEKRITIIDNKNNQSDTETSMKTSIFLSYSWENKNFANRIDNMFLNRGISLTKDERAIEYTQSIKAYMKNVRTSNYVLMLISEEYLKSSNCMYEVLEFVKDYNYRNRILPLIHDQTDIFNPNGKIKYIKYWEEELKKLKNKVNEISNVNAIKILEEINRIDEIAKTIGEFLDVITDMNSIIFHDEISNDNFNHILKRIGVKI